MDSTAKATTTLPRATLEAWHAAGIFLLDLREQSELTYEFTSNVVVNIPWSEQKLRSHEYPSRSTRFALLCSPANADDQVDWFTNADLHPTKHPWQVEFYVLDTPATRAAALKLAIVAAPDTPRPYPLARLWTPNSLMTHLLPRLIQAATTAASAPTPSPVVFDLGCGSGRDIMFLAEELQAQGATSWRFCGVDHNKTGMATTTAFARRRRVHDAYSFVQMDLRKLDAVQRMLERHQSDVQCVFGCRFLHRDLLTVVRDVLPVGGIFAWSHFAMPADGQWRWQHPSKPRDILRRDELATLFAQDFDVLLNVFESDSDHGRPLNQFIAVRRTPG
ncbi:hypothetical protein H310_06409 [Aphanomyces invadans]|uniref:Uncharacterized protein n=1 Tax=Aphanomyces invadans TaxID=157072 RepID=A0A024U8C3_9STRA|nr:hypothetical protein H310_06409 [Aphanomyces invadans]ETW01838.1 hypothetical protein H310_06409 [Aphanomyces invadans]|eukprot:XP_008869686.1 hypothetical protein H310_06409 [Aphanomyces invadans]